MLCSVNKNYLNNLLYFILQFLHCCNILNCKNLIEKCKLRNSLTHNFFIVTFMYEHKMCTCIGLVCVNL